MFTARRAIREWHSEDLQAVSYQTYKTGKTIYSLVKLSIIGLLTYVIIFM